MRADWGARVAACVLLTIAASSLAAPWLAPYDPDAISLGETFLPPSRAHWFGTDELGRDLLSRALHGGRVSAAVGLVAVGVSAAIGVTLGATAGVFSGWVDVALMRLVDLMLCFPSFFLILAVVAFLDPSIWNIMLVIGLTSWMGVARLVRAEFLRLRAVDFVAAARVAGAGEWRLATRVMLPNALPPVLVHATLGIASAILVESGLSFLGLGVQPPTPSWGNMLIAGKDSLSFAWWISLFPGALILVTVLSINVVGQHLQDRFDPRQQGRRA
jgi:peptide/nickel transport system permease protein